MAELIREHSTAVRTADGERFIARVYGSARADGTWEAWLEFAPIARSTPVLRTDRETSQPNRAAVVYWADGLEPIYLEGAFARAQVVIG
jgi:hypothetical protein